MESEEAPYRSAFRDLPCFRSKEKKAERAQQQRGFGRTSASTFHERGSWSTAMSARKCRDGRDSTLGAPCTSSPSIACQHDPRPSGKKRRRNRDVGASDGVPSLTAVASTGAPPPSAYLREGVLQTAMDLSDPGTPTVSWRSSARLGGVEVDTAAETPPGGAASAAGWSSLAGVPLETVAEAADSGGEPEGGAALSERAGPEGNSPQSGDEGESDPEATQLVVSDPPPCSFRNLSVVAEAPLELPIVPSSVRANSKRADAPLGPRVPCTLSLTFI